MSEEIDENNLNKIEQNLWANAFVLIYEKGIQMVVGRAIAEAQKNQKILHGTGHTMNPQIDGDKLIDENSAEICKNARMWANELIKNYRKSK